MDNTLLNIFLGNMKFNNRVIILSFLGLRLIILEFYKREG